MDSIYGRLTKHQRLALNAFNHALGDGSGVTEAMLRTHGYRGKIKKPKRRVRKHKARKAW
jgi:hypothetical protein